MPKKTNTSIDLDAETRGELNKLLNQHLADTFDLYSHTKQAHWNVKGSQFFQLHELYARMGNKTESLQHLQTFERLTQEAQNRDREIFQKTQDKR